MATDLRQTHFRFGKDDGTESSHTFWQSEDTDHSQLISSDWTFLLRFCEQEVGGLAAANTDAVFQYNKNSAGWTDITTTSSVVKAVAVNAFANGDHCTKRLSGTGTFETSGAGCTEDGSSGGNANDIAASGCSETECGLQVVAADVSNGDTIQFRFRSPDWTVTYTVTPTLTIQKSVIEYGAATLSGAGTVTANGNRTRGGKGTLAGTGALAGIGVRILAGALLLSGAGSLAVAGQRVRVGSATLSGTGEVACIGTVVSGAIEYGSATLSGSGSLGVAGKRDRGGKGTLSGSGDLAAIGNRARCVQATLSGTGELAGQGNRTRGGTAELEGSGDLAATASLTRIGQVSFSGTGSLTASGTTGDFEEGSVTFSGTGTLKVIGRVEVILIDILELECPT